MELTLVIIGITVICNKQSLSNWMARLTGTQTSLSTDQWNLQMTSSKRRNLLKLESNGLKSVTWNASRRARNSQLSLSCKFPASVSSSSMALLVFGAAGAQPLESLRPTSHSSLSSSSLLSSSLAPPCSSLHTPRYAPDLSRLPLPKILSGLCMTTMTWSLDCGPLSSSGCSHSWSSASAAPTPAHLKSKQTIIKLQTKQKLH